jgi:UDPglucose 6-dehydrogenase
MMEATDAANEQQKIVFLDKIFESYGRHLHGMSFAVRGLAFKPNTDDMREAPSCVIIAALLQAGATVVAHDPNNLAQLAQAQAELEQSQAREAMRATVRVVRIDGPDASVSKTM